MEIGFIGLGAMGRAMAARLLSAGHRLRVWNRSPGPARELAGQGAEAVGGPAEAFRGDVAITMLADDAAYRSVGLAGPLLDQAPRGMIHLNMATVSVELTRELAAAHAERGLGYVAAPVFGRGDVAAAGKLTIVASGPEEALDRAAPLFDTLGQRTWRLGSDPSQAAAAKIAGNFMIASVIETIGEATTLAARHGVPAENAARGPDQLALQRAGVQELRHHHRGPEIPASGIPVGAGPQGRPARPRGGRRCQGSPPLCQRAPGCLPGSRRPRRRRSRLGRARRGRPAPGGTRDRCGSSPAGLIGRENRPRGRPVILQL